MNETLVTLVGNAATGVDFRETASGGMARFRFAVTPRRWDREKQLWADGHTSFYTVWAWRTLAANLSGSVAVGEPLVVHGRLKVREEEREGQRRTFVDIEAVAVGHDLTRGTSAFRRVVRGEPGLTVRTDGQRADEPDRWAVRDRPTDPEAPPELTESRGAEGPQAGADRAEPREAKSAPAAAGRAGRPGAARRTVRQKRDAELVSAP